MKEKIEKAIQEFLEEEGYFVRMNFLDTEGKEEDDRHFPVPYMESEEDGKIIEMIGRFRIRVMKK